MEKPTAKTVAMKRRCFYCNEELKGRNIDCVACSRCTYEHDKQSGRSTVFDGRCSSSFTNTKSDSGRTSLELAFAKVGILARPREKR
jgi:hypothetical protein